MAASASAGSTTCTCSSGAPRRTSSCSARPDGTTSGCTAPSSPPPEQPVSRRPVGLVLPSNESGGAAVLAALAAEAEGWGYQSLWFTDHVVGVRAMAGTYGSYWLDP